jgi:predicted acylesterase/phospholipase RssA
VKNRLAAGREPDDGLEATPEHGLAVEGHLRGVHRLLELRIFPEARDFPVLLAARMSHSFPVLFSSISLWAIDYANRNEKTKFRRCWFSDGGISSNSPMHLFDSFLPAWPTLGIQLEDRLPHQQDVFLPTRYDDGYHDLWDPFDEQAQSARRLSGFLVSVFFGGAELERQHAFEDAKRPRSYRARAARSPQRGRIQP